MAKTIDQLAKESLKEKGYILTSPDGMHMAEIEAINMFKRGANAVLEEIDDELMRSFLEDYKEFSNEDREIAQGVIGTIHMWVKQQMSEQQ